MTTFQPSGISVNLRQNLDEGSARSGTTLDIDPIITLDGRRVTMSDIGDIGFAKLSQGTSSEEIISFTGITDNTTYYTLTGCVWGYNFYNTTGSVNANKKRHVAGAKFSIATDYHFLATQLVNVDDVQTISGKKTFSTVPDSTSDPIDDNDLARKSYVDGVVAGTFPANRIVVAGTAGETVAAGELVYFDTTDDEWKLCDADTASTVENVRLGIAQGAGTDGNAIASGVLLQGLDTNQTGMTIGDVMYAGNTAGAIASSAGTTEVSVGIAKSATELYFSPRFTLALTADQQDALAGTSGTPSTSNKYVTADDVSATSAANKIPRFDSNGELDIASMLAIASEAQGDILYRGASAWARLGAGTSGQILQTQGAGANPQWVANTKILAKSFSDVTVSGTNAETTLTQFSIPANTLSTVNAVRGRIYISDCDIPSGEGLDIALKYGSTEMVNFSTGATIAATLTNGKGFIEFILLANASTSAQVLLAWLHLQPDTVVPSGAESAIWHTQGEGTATEDSTGALNFTVTADFTTATSTSVTASMYIVELITG